MTFIPDAKRVINNLHYASKKLPNSLSHDEKISHTFNHLSKPLKDLNFFVNTLRIINDSFNIATGLLSNGHNSPTNSNTDVILYTSTSLVNELNLKEIQSTFLFTLSIYLFHKYALSSSYKGREKGLITFQVL